jgi:hypothetical protein
MALCAGNNSQFLPKPRSDLCAGRCSKCKCISLGHEIAYSIMTRGLWQTAKYRPSLGRPACVARRSTIIQIMIFEPARLGLPMQCSKPGAEISASTNPAILVAENARLVQELAEARQQQAVTSEILSIISRSPTDLQPVLDAVAESAARLCEAIDASIFRVDGDRLRLIAPTTARSLKGPSASIPCP